MGALPYLFTELARVISLIEAFINLFKNIDLRFLQALLNWVSWLRFSKLWSCPLHCKWGKYL